MRYWKLLELLAQILHTIFDILSAQWLLSLTGMHQVIAQIAKLLKKLDNLFF